MIGATVLIITIAVGIFFGAVFGFADVDEDEGE